MITGQPDRAEIIKHQSARRIRLVLSLALVLIFTLLVVGASAFLLPGIFPWTPGQLIVAIVFISGFSAALGAYLAFRPFSRLLRSMTTLEAYQASEDRYRALFEGIPVGLYSTTPDGRIIDANAAMIAMLGFPDRASLLQLKAQDLYIDPHQRLHERDLVDQAGELFNFEIQLQRFDGSPIWVRDSVSAVKDADGQVLYYDGSLEDITERKQMEQYLLRTERLAAMGQIMASLAHEIKNPLQAIQSNLELLQDPRLEPDERQEHLDICLSETERLIGITQPVLGLRRLERHTVRPVSLARVWEETFAIMNKPLENAGIQTTTEFPEDLPPFLGMSEQIKQVLINLVLNAIQAMKGGGNLRLSAGCQAQELRLELANNGPPIPAEYIDSIFDPFFSTQSEGSGLGLFISHHIIQQHGGALTVKNLEDEAGVVFTITLPVSPYRND